MSRASRRDNSTSASLFPFLAVLLCTMGVLVVLLVVMASVQLSQAKDKKLLAEAPPAIDQQEQARLSTELASVRQQQQQVDDAHARLTERLKDEQLRLAQVEENIRRRQERLAVLRMEIEELKELDGASVDDIADAKEQLERQRELIAQTEDEIEQLKEQAEKQPKSYAIVPYEGPSGTRRQPIYIECREDVVIFQPEGIELTPSDFNKAMLAGGPLPSAIRAAQLYYRTNGLSSQKQAYPLVLGRPRASNSLARVIGTLSTIKADFGYEVVDDDWELDYSAADPALSDEIARAVENARRRLAALRETAPGTFVANSITTFEPGPSWIEKVQQGSLSAQFSSMGGGAESGGSSVLLSRQPIDVNRLAQALKSTQGTTTTTGENLASGGGGNFGPSAASSTKPLDRYAAADQARAAQGSGGPAGASTSIGDPSSQTDPTAASEDALGSKENRAGEPATSEQLVAEGSPDSSSNSSFDAASSLTASAASGGGPPPPGALANNSGTAAVGGATSGGETTGQQSGPINAQSPQPEGMALVRTIRVQVSRESLLVRSGKRTVADSKIDLAGDRRQAALAFIEAIREEVKRWGIAGNGLYWQPVLDISVMPGGEQLAQQVAGVLRQSGVEVRLALLP